MKSLKVTVASASIAALVIGLYVYMTPVKQGVPDTGTATIDASGIEISIDT